MIREKILEPFERNIRPQMRGYLSNYTMDVALCGNESHLYFIEPNGFGADYSAGSALFGWTQDHETLHDASFIEFRYTRYADEDEKRARGIKQ